MSTSEKNRVAIIIAIVAAIGTALTAYTARQCAKCPDVIECVQPGGKALIKVDAGVQHGDPSQDPPG